MSSKPVGSGALVGGYRLEARVGAGQMGVVWRAARTSDGAVVAVKLLRDDLVADRDLVRRFTRERDALLRVSGPHVASVRDLILEGDTIALVTEYLAGGDLRRWLDRHGPRPAAEAAALAIQVFDGLASAHRSGIVHRDVKPANILLKDDQSQPELVLADFSLAHLAGSTITRHSHAVMGTPMYLAPEVIKGSPATSAADLYAAGIVFYELLAGASPFVGNHPWTVMHAHIEQEPPRPHGCPDELWQILGTLLTKDPEGRPGTAEAVSGQLREALRALEEPNGSGPAQSRSGEIVEAVIEGAAQGAAGAVAEHAAETLIEHIQGAPHPPPGSGRSAGGPEGPEPGVAEPGGPAAPPTPEANLPPDPTPASGGTTTGNGVQAGAAAGSTSAGSGIVSVLAKVAAAVCVAVGVPALINALDAPAEDVPTTATRPSTTQPPAETTRSSTTPTPTPTTRPSTTTPRPTTTTTPPPIPPVADVGECVEIDSALTDVVAVGECRPGSSATYRVDAVVDTPGGCPNPQQAYMSSGDFLLCLDLNIYERYCYEMRSDAGRTHVTAVDCGSSTAWHVVAIIPGATGGQAEAVCPSAYTHHYWEFQAPQMVVCTSTV